MNVDVRILFPNVMQEIDIPLKRQFRVMSALHQDLNSAYRGEFIELLIDLLEGKNIMVRITLGPIKSAKLAVDIADVRVVDVSVYDVGDDLASPAAVTFRLCQIAPAISKRTEFFQRPSIQLEDVVRRNPFALQDFVC